MYRNTLWVKPIPMFLVSLGAGIPSPIPYEGLFCGHPLPSTRLLILWPSLDASYIEKIVMEYAMASRRCINLTRYRPAFIPIKKVTLTTTPQTIAGDWVG